MSNLIKKLVDAARQFTTTEFAIFKISLLTIGILLGVYFSLYLLKCITIIWIVAALSWLILIIRLISYLRRPKN